MWFNLCTLRGEKWHFVVYADARSVMQMVNSVVFRVRQPGHRRHCTWAGIPASPLIDREPCLISLSPSFFAYEIGMETMVLQRDPVRSKEVVRFCVGTVPDT